MPPATVEDAQADRQRVVDADAQRQAKAAAQIASERQQAVQTEAEAAAALEARRAAGQRQAEAEAQRQAEAAAEAQRQAEAAAQIASERQQAVQTEAEAAAALNARQAKAAARAEAAALQAQRQADAEMRRAEREAEAAAAAQAAQTQTAAEAVSRQTITDTTARSSAVDPAQAAQGDNGGLSNFEKALLLGLGAVAVGTLLNNGDRVVERGGDRIVIDGADGLRVLRDETALLRRPGSEVRTETFADGSTRTTVAQPDGRRVVTVATATGRVMERFVVRPDGSEISLIDDREAAPVDLSTLPSPRPLPERAAQLGSEAALRAALQAEMGASAGRQFLLGQVRELRAVRELAPAIEVGTVAFATGSAATAPSEADGLVALGQAIRELIAEEPSAVILVEVHTDAVGNAASNLALSDRRAESMALALTEYFDVPPENLVTQGYGEAVLKVPTTDAERANRRALVRNVTSLLQQVARPPRP